MDVLLFHHALGLTSGVHAFADRLRSDGHRVATPDLFDGRTFDTIEAGVAHAETLGLDVITERGVDAGADCGDHLVCAGFSLGVLPAQKLAQTRSGVAGLLAYAAALPIQAFGDAWPDGVAVQVHLGEDDPWAQEDLAAAEALVEAARGELCLYPTAAHLVADNSTSDFDERIAGLIVERSLHFLRSLD